MRKVQKWMLLSIVSVFVIPSLANAGNMGFFVGKCGGSKIAASTLNGACKKNEGAFVVKCKNACTKRKFLKCVSRSWKQLASRQCPMKKCGTKTLTFTVKNTGKKKIWLRAALYKTKGSIFLRGKNEIKSPAFMLLKNPDKAQYYLEPGQTRVYQIKVGLKLKCKLKRKLKILFRCIKSPYAVAKNRRQSTIKRLYSKFTSPGVLNFGTITFSKDKCVGYLNASSRNLGNILGDGFTLGAITKDPDAF